MLPGSILQQLAIAHEQSPRPLRFGVYYKNTLVALCHALEDSILSSHSQPLVIAAFQRGKWYLQEAERYQELAAESRQVVIMAAAESGFFEHSTSQLANVALVDLDPTDPVAQEWHLIILSPTYTAMVLCQELSPSDYGAAGLPKTDLERKFYGFWTFEPALVQEIVELAIAHIGKYNPSLQQTLTAQVKDIVAAGDSPLPEDLSGIVSRVVDYLQISQEDLIANQHPEVAAAQQPVLDVNLVSNKLQAFVRMAQLIELVSTGNPMATSEVAALAEVMGQMLDLPAWQLKRLKLAGWLHGLVALPITENLVVSPFPSCSLVSEVQALRRMPRLQAIAHIITHQTEWWNGQGIPAGIAGEAIPLESRILGLIAHFDRLVNQFAQELPNSPPQEIWQQALGECQTEAGDRWEPKLVETLTLLVMGMQQGLSLPIAPPKITSGIWLLDTPQAAEIHTAEANRNYIYGT